MRRVRLFSFRVNDYERRMIAALAKRLQRSQSDAVRWLVLNASRELARLDTQDKNASNPQSLASEV